MDDLISRKEAPEYIERQAALDALLWELCGTGYQSHGMRAVEHVPVADVEPVRHGRWKQCFEDWRQQMEGDECSACGFQHYGTSIRDYHYCPNCGAKMDLGGCSDQPKEEVK